MYSRQQAAARSPSPGKGTLDISVTCVGPEIDLTMIRAKEGVKCEWGHQVWGLGMVIIGQIL